MPSLPWEWKIDLHFLNKIFADFSPLLKYWNDPPTRGVCVRECVWVRECVCIWVLVSAWVCASKWINSLSLQMYSLYSSRLSCSDEKKWWQFWAFQCLIYLSPQTASVNKLFPSKLNGGKKLRRKIPWGIFQLPYSSFPTHNVTCLVLVSICSSALFKDRGSLSFSCSYSLILCLSPVISIRPME